MLLILVIFISAVLTSILSSFVATRKGWDSSNWMLIGFFTGGFGLIAAAGLPDRTQRRYLRLIAEAQGVKEARLDEVKEPSLDRDQRPSERAQSIILDGSCKFETDSMAKATELFEMACKCFGDSASEADFDKSFIGANRIELISRKGELIGEFLGHNVNNKEVWEKVSKDHGDKC